MMNCTLLGNLREFTCKYYTHKQYELPELLWAGETGFGDRFGDPEMKKDQ